MKTNLVIFSLVTLIVISSTKSHSGTIVDEAKQLVIQNSIKYGATYKNWDQYVSLSTSGKVPEKLVCNEFVSLVLARACTFNTPPASTTITGLSSFLQMTQSDIVEDLKAGDILFLKHDSGKCHDDPPSKILHNGVGDHVGVVIQVTNFGSGIGGVFLAESGSKKRSCLSVLQEDPTSPDSWKQLKGGRIIFYPYYYIKRFMVGYASPPEPYCTMSQGRGIPLSIPSTTSTFGEE